ncbi:MAG: mevalonate kinase [Chloroflexi bacterium]|jgi:mevalonate kinase|nr:mevalonate kinase [Chloroflexota bacterium]MBT3668872.1 mevalonate kinase [Chloroflexota bacterium]MBT4004221.1 mevalonate kinase [Chloroflexota bacterium]MBT4306586.1 mevalonate kinase [Chloroflexota bacterium]MBT4533970.1 mevalonate kinase [Chloroflexota bacterium]
MPALSASAPGKIILFGEHSVVYQQPAIAVPVMEVKAIAIASPAIGKPSNTVQVIAPDIEINSTLKTLPLDHAISMAIDLTLKELGISDYPAFNLRISSTIPLAAGLGSGASVSVAIIRVVSNFLGQTLSDEVVSQLAYEVEKIHHGTPSGIDNSVVTFAQPVYFIKDRLLETFPIGKPFTIVIGDTGIKSSTAVSVGDVRKAWQADQKVYEDFFESCGTIAKKAREHIENGEIKKLGPLMDENHALLQKMNVSSKELDTLVLASRDAGAWGAKLSGGGRGGNMIALVDEDSSENVADALMNTGAVQTIITKVGN